MDRAHQELATKVHGSLAASEQAWCYNFLGGNFTVVQDPQLLTQL